MAVIDIFFDYAVSHIEPYHIALWLLITAASGALCAALYKKGRIDGKSAVILPLLVLYLLLVLRLTLLNRPRNADYAYTLDFDRLIRALQKGKLRPMADQLWNVVLFVPLGFLLAALCEGKHTVHPFLMVVLASFTIEVTQFLTRRGVFELSDLVLNSLGGLIGVLIIAVPHRRAGRTLLPSCESDRSASDPRR